MNLAIKLSLLRIILAFIFLFFASSRTVASQLVALALFIIASVTDYYDGKIARAKNQVTDFGKFLDPLADKILISTAFISFIGHADLGIPPWIVVIIISREFIITGLRNMLQIRGVAMAADLPGKFKTTLQIVVIIMIMLISAFSGQLESAGFHVVVRRLPFLLMLLTGILTIFSGVNYFVKYRAELRAGLPPDGR